ncbi:MAG TPA: ribonuclease III [Casimicrobiaceae bacterium]|nr:ribonuclease III [Casimicrobiaceae bacterium]
MRASSSSSKRARPAASEPPSREEPASGAPRVGVEHAFANPDLLRQALTHRSYGTPNNERLEFIGDAVLGFVVALSLYERFPDAPEGHLTRARAHLVRENTLAQVARRIGLGRAIRVGEGELKSGGTDRESILADAMEAVFGAVFLDAGFAPARAAIVAAYGDVLRDADPARLGKDPKTRLQEALHKRRLPEPAYEIVATTGKAHAQQFAVECRIPELAIVTRGAGASRRAAEQDAATQAFDLLPAERRDG